MPKQNWSHLKNTKPYNDLTKRMRSVSRVLSKCVDGKRGNRTKISIFPGVDSSKRTVAGQGEVEPRSAWLSLPRWIYQIGFRENELDKINKKLDN